jgi:sporulation protein YlmC with PRC-barrel domain
MEAIEINDEIQDFILKGANEENILEAARRNGFISMKEDAIIKSLEHTIPFEEVSTLGGDLIISDEAEEEALALKKDDGIKAEEDDVPADEVAPPDRPVDNPEPFKV